MSGLRSVRNVLAGAVVVLGLSGRAMPVLAQSAPATVAPAPVDSGDMWVGDWDFTAQLGDNNVAGTFRVNYANKVFSGVVARPGFPIMPIKSFRLRTGREFIMEVEWNGEPYTFQGRLDNPRRITGSVGYRGGIGRLRVEKRAG
jgi:hypothetical protein